MACTLEVDTSSSSSLNVLKEDNERRDVWRFGTKVDDNCLKSYFQDQSIPCWNSTQKLYSERLSVTLHFRIDRQLTFTNWL